MDVATPVVQEFFDQYEDFWQALRTRGVLPAQMTRLNVRRTSARSGSRSRRPLERSAAY